MKENAGGPHSGRAQRLFMFLLPLGAHPVKALGQDMAAARLRIRCWTASPAVLPNAGSGCQRRSLPPLLVGADSIKLDLSILAVVTVKCELEPSLSGIVLVVSGERSEHLLPSSIIIVLVFSHRPCIRCSQRTAARRNACSRTVSSARLRIARIALPRMSACRKPGRRRTGTGRIRRKPPALFPPFAGRWGNDTQRGCGLRIGDIVGRPGR